MVATRAMRQVQLGVWLTELCARSSAELTTLFQALGLLGASLLACTCKGWKQAIDEFRAEETSLDEWLDDRWVSTMMNIWHPPLPSPFLGVFRIISDPPIESVLKFFACQFGTRVLPRYVALRTLILDPDHATVLANKAWPELRSLRTHALAATEVSSLVAGALACRHLREFYFHTCNDMLMTDDVLQSLLGCPQLRRLWANCLVHEANPMKELAEENQFAGAHLVHALDDPVQPRRVHATRACTQQGPGCQLLELLSLRGCSQLEQGMHAVAAQCPALRVVDLYRCSQVTAASIAALGCCPDLSILNLECCSCVDDAVIAALVQGCPRLMDVNLMDTSVSDAGLATILTAPMLESLQAAPHNGTHPLSWEAVAAARKQQPHLKGLEWVDDAAKSETPGRLILIPRGVCLDANGGEIYFKCGHMMRLEKLMQAFCDRQSMSMESVSFFFDGSRIYGDQRPGQLDMLDGGATPMSFLARLSVSPSLGLPPPCFGSQT